MIASISVIIPVYNGEKFILEALSSVCAQTVLPLEIVVADDASTDNTRALVESFAKKSNVPVKLCVMNKNSGGPYAPASMAFNSTLGDYVCILDADDIFAPEAFETYMNMFEENSTLNKKTGLSTSDFITFDDGDGKTILASYLEQQSSAIGELLSNKQALSTTILDDHAQKIYANSFCIPFKGMLTRKAWVKLGGPNLNYKIVCDVEFVWRLIMDPEFSIAISPKKLVRVRISSGSMSKNRIDMSLELVKFMKSMRADLREKSLKKIMTKRIQQELYGILYESYKNRKLSTFFRSGFSYVSGRIGALLE